MKSIKLFLFLILLYGCTNEDNLEIVGTTETFVLESSIVSDNYPIFVYVPESYNNNSSVQLIIALDGEYRFNTIANLVSTKIQNGSMPPSIFVAIGNNKERNRDYTPTPYLHGTGGAENFYLFIKDELIPELESRYSIISSNSKTLMGHSFGGLFTQYVMAQQRASNPFNKFIAGGTSYWYDAGVIFEYEQAYADTHNDLDVTFFNGMGTLEGGVMLASFEEMNKMLGSRKFSSFKHKNELINKSGHKGSAKVIFDKGLDYVFNN